MDMVLRGRAFAWGDYGLAFCASLNCYKLLPQNLVPKFIYPKFVAQNLLPQIDYASHNLDSYAPDSYTKALTDHLHHAFSFAVSCDGISSAAGGSAVDRPGPVAKTNT